MSATLLIIIVIALIIFMFRLNADNQKHKKRLDWLIQKINSLEEKISGHKIIGETTRTEKVEEKIEEPERPLIKDIPEPEATPSTKPIIEKPKFFKTIEAELSNRWMIWLGGIAFAIGGGFLVKYSIDAGLLSPAIRVTLGTLIGIIMTVAGEGIRGRRAKAGFSSDFPDYIPGAISAAGLFTAFAAIYSSYALYDLISPLIAFTALAALSFLSTGIAYNQGRFFAYLGMIGGLLIPALVSTGSGDAFALFPYLLVISASSLWISRKKAWTDVAGVTLLLAVLWAVLWIFTNWKVGDIIPVGTYLIILSAMNMMLLSGASPARSKDMTIKGLIPSHPVTIMSDVVTLLSIILLVSIVRLEHYNSVGFVLVSLGLLGQAYAIHKSPEYDTGGICAIFGIIFLLGSWHVPDLFELQDILTEAQARQFIWSPIAPPGLQTFTSASLALVGIVSLAIFIRLPWAS